MKTLRNKNSAVGSDFNEYNDSIESRIRLFRGQQEKFRSNPLPTELPNPETYNLSDMAKSDLNSAVKTLRKIDMETIHKMKDYIHPLKKLRQHVLTTINSGHKIYICGCGASGRLAVLIEFLWRKTAPADLKDSVTGFLAGGDTALIKSIEGFEDHREYGIKQLYLAGFNDGDLLISVTASGESLFAIGATDEAAKTTVRPWFIHCNTNDALNGRVKNHVIQNSNTEVLSLFIGPMALTGSTRMQATTALMLAIGLPLFYENIEAGLTCFAESFANLKLDDLTKFIAHEAEIYKNREFIFYNASPELGITVLTDTTERAPTFNLDPFENQNDDFRVPSFCYLLFSDLNNAKEAWNLLLGRQPRVLDWSTETSLKRLYGFDFSKQLIRYRNNYAVSYHNYYIKKNSDGIMFGLDRLKINLKLSNAAPLFEQITLKIILNICSTLVFGRLGYYEGNLMTSLYPSNSKLIDRAVRYIDFLINIKTNKNIPYNVLAEYMFEELRLLKPNESIVLKTVDKIMNCHIK